MMRSSLIGWLGILALVTGSRAHADESLFGYIYTTDSLPKGAWEAEHHTTLRSGKARGFYRSFDLREEIEYGVTDNFSASLYLNSSWLAMDGVYSAEDVSQNLPTSNRFDINGTSVELKYRLLSPYTDPIGLSLYLEPEIEIRDKQTGDDKVGKALEFRAILHKTFLEDTLTFASNIMFEPEWETAGDGAASRELWAEFTLGSSYRIMTGWWVGAEFRNHREFPRMDFGAQEHSAYFLGPTVHYGEKAWWATLTVLPQLAGSPEVLGIGSDGSPIDGGSLHLGQHEKLEVRLKLGFNL